MNRCSIFVFAILISIYLNHSIVEAQQLDQAEQPLECKEPEHYVCRNGNCLPAMYLCDGDDDCGDNSDELKSSCSSIKCSENEFQCRSGRCVEKQARCDRQAQCRDGSDEEGCTYPPCPSGQFACANNSQCLSMSEVCDGTIDCKDGYASDELHPSPCTPNVTCPEFAFKCNTTNVCALPNWLCDGENDCADYSDEDPYLCSTRPCPEGYFRCADHRCIPESALCNGVVDCKDGLASDERQPNPCPRNATCPPGFYSCAETTICAYPYSMCDDNDDCGDGSDEKKENCESFTCPEEWFRCKNNRCIPPNWLCDGGKDCSNFEDEINCPDQSNSTTPASVSTQASSTQNYRSPNVAQRPQSQSVQSIGQKLLRKPGH